MRELEVCAAAIIIRKQLSKILFDCFAPSEHCGIPSGLLARHLALEVELGLRGQGALVLLLALALALGLAPVRVRLPRRRVVT